MLNRGFSYKTISASVTSAVLALGLIVSAVPAHAAPDTIPPTYPSGLTANVLAPLQIRLAWNQAGDNVGVVGYKVYRNNVVIGMTPNLNFTDAAVVSGTTYSYAVSAFDAAGNNSIKSPVKMVTAVIPPTDTIAPSIPQGLSGGADTISSVKLNWSPSSDNVGVAGYKVFRNGTQIATAPTPLFIDSTVVNGATYSYAVAAYDAVGNTSAQGYATSITFYSAPQAPYIGYAAGKPLDPYSGEPARVLLMWSGAYQSTNGITVTYNVYRDGSLIWSTANGVPFLDTAVSSGSTYGYQVQAVSSTGQSVWGNLVYVYVPF